MNGHTRWITRAVGALIILALTSLWAADRAHHQAERARIEDMAKQADARSHMNETSIAVINAKLDMILEATRRIEKAQE